MSDKLTSIARGLRRRQTEEERKLWARLRDRRLGGLKFRRQAPCGDYVADFLCEEARLVVEVDGSQHAVAGVAEADLARTRRLSELGYEVLRVWNSDINRNLRGVLEGITEAARTRKNPSSAPSGHLLPSGEGNLPQDHDNT